MRPKSLTIVAIFSLGALGSAPAHADGFEKTQRRSPRVKAAFEKHLVAVADGFRDAGAAWPPRGIFLRAFKLEGVLELWADKAGAAAGSARVLVRSIPVCASSGVLGPKRRQGDLQVPEGFYTIDRFNPRSSYHLSLGIDYPNAVDERRAGDDPPGSDIFIHGDCVTVGCLPLEDEPVEALYVAAVRARDQGQQRIPVHIFPCRFGSEACRAATAGADAELASFWALLALAHAEFEATHIPPPFVATRDGYRRR